MEGETIHRETRREKLEKNLTQEVINECISYQSILKYFDIPVSGSGAALVKEVIEDKKLDISHFKHQGWNKDMFDYSRFQKGKAIKAASARPALIALRGQQCENCGITEWEGHPIPLEVHHIDGDGLNNEMDNLLLLCPNCHALTKNWRRPQTKIMVSEEDFVEALKTTPNIRQALLKIGLAPKGGNYKRAYELMAKYNL